jgi:hypothetical protein
MDTPFTGNPKKPCGRTAMQARVHQHSDAGGPHLKSTAQLAQRVSTGREGRARGEDNAA